VPLATEMPKELTSISVSYNHEFVANRIKEIQDSIMDHFVLPSSVFADMGDKFATASDAVRKFTIPIHNGTSTMNFLGMDQPIYDEVEVEAPPAKPKDRSSRQIKL
jgi:hypothetical protein